MFWDKIAGFYDFFEKCFNGEVNKKLVAEVADLIEKDDVVLECACGTGMITGGISPRCKEVVATDFSEGMLGQARKNCVHLKNVKIEKADIMHLGYEDEAFDKVVAGNVIHLLDEPYKALEELMRVCKNGGYVIIPTYINNKTEGKPKLVVKCLEKLGADFKKEFTFDSYKQFFYKAGFEEVQYKLIKGKLPCAIAVIRKGSMQQSSFLE